MTEQPAPSPLETGELTPVEVRLDAMYTVGRDVAVVAERPTIDWRSRNMAVYAGARETFLRGNPAGREVLDGYLESSSSNYKENMERIQNNYSASEYSKLREGAKSNVEGAPLFTATDLSVEAGKQMIKVHPGRLREMGGVIGQWGEECVNFNPKEKEFRFRDLLRYLLKKRRTQKFERLDATFGEVAKFRKGLHEGGYKDDLLLFDTILSGFMAGLQVIERGKPIPLSR